MFLKYYCELNFDCVHWLVQTVENGKKTSELKKLRNILDLQGNQYFLNWDPALWS